MLTSPFLSLAMIGFFFFFFTNVYNANLILRSQSDEFAQLLHRFFFFYSAVSCIFSSCGPSPKMLALLIINRTVVETINRCGLVFWGISFHLGFLRTLFAVRRILCDSLPIYSANRASGPLCLVHVESATICLHSRCCPQAEGRESLFSNPGRTLKMFISLRSCTWPPQGQWGRSVRVSQGQSAFRL